MQLLQRMQNDTWYHPNDEVCPGLGRWQQFLFNLTADPHERRNLQGGVYSQLAAKLGKQLAQAWDEQGMQIGENSKDLSPQVFEAFDAKGGFVAPWGCSLDSTA